MDVNGVREEITSIDGKRCMMLAYQYTGHVHRRSLFSSPNIRLCQDGYVFLVGFGATTGAMFFPVVAKMLGLSPEQKEAWGKPEVVNDPVKQGEFDETIMTPWLLEHTVREVVEKAQAAGVLSTPYNNIEGVLSDLHFRERNYWVEIDHPATGRLTYPGAPIRMGRAGWKMRMPAPFLGQHNQEVYGSLGYSKQDLVNLRQTGVI